MKTTSERLRRLILASAIALLGACGTTGEEEDEQKGGDHLPEDQVYAVQSLPEGARSIGLTATESTSRFLGRFIHLAERYQVCLDREAFEEAELESLEARLTAKSGGLDAYGLEAILNHALATVDRFLSDAKRASSRLVIQLQWNDAPRCHAVATKAAATAFPFDQEEYRAVDRVMFHSRRLKVPTGELNAVPVIYVRDDLQETARNIALQFAIGRFLGLGKSKLAGSYLNPETGAATQGRGWRLQNGDGTLRLDDDAQILYGFALIYRDVLKVSDLGTFHYYEDQLHPREPSEDESLVSPADAVAATFVDLPGNPHLTGVRLIDAQVAICVRDISGADLSGADWESLMSFIDPAVEGTLMQHLNAAEPTIGATAKIVDKGCELQIEVRNGQQFPFAGRSLNGLYAREGSIKAKGIPSKIPVIYLNADNLDFVGTGTSTKKAATLVLRHEFAHFMGFRHSPSSKSLLSPSGYNTGWDPPGGDQAMFDEFIDRWREQSAP